MKKREIAWRAFAVEFNNSNYMLQSTGEFEPSYIITPLGAKINRIYISGVLTEKDKRENMIKADIFDTTGVFKVYAFDEEHMKMFDDIEIPSFVSAIGKGRIYSPEEGVYYVSINAEIIKKVNAEIKDYWIYETAIHTMKRISGIEEARNFDEVSIDKIFSLGYNRQISEGIFYAVKEYGQIDTEYYRKYVVEALKSIIVESFSTIEVESKILRYIEEMDKGDGVLFEELVERAKNDSIDRIDVEETINILTEKREIYEYELGKFKKI